MFLKRLSHKNGGSLLQKQQEMTDGKRFTYRKPVGSIYKLYYTFNLYILCHLYK